MIFKQLAMMAILFFKKRPKFCTDNIFIAINIPCEFGEDIFINE